MNFIWRLNSPVNRMVYIPLPKTLFEQVIHVLSLVYTSLFEVTKGTLVGREPLTSRNGNLCNTANHANGFLDVTEHADVLDIYG